MIDADWRPYIIECNTNPCINLTSPYLARLIPEMIENVFKLTVDVIYPEIPTKRRIKAPAYEKLPKNKFELIFHEHVDGENLK